MIFPIPTSFSIIGLVLLFLGIFISSLGMPGGSLIVIALGSLSSNFSVLLLVVLVTFISAVLGDIFAYEIARRLSNKLRNKLNYLPFYSANESRAKNQLNKYGFFIIFITRFALTSLCSVISYVAGLEKIKRKKFFLAVIFGEFLFAITYSLIGFAIGEIFNNLLTAINYIVIVIVLLALVFYIIKFFIKRRRKFIYLESRSL